MSLELFFFFFCCLFTYGQLPKYWSKWRTKTTWMYHEPLSPKLFYTLQRQLDSAKMKHRYDLTIMLIHLKGRNVSRAVFFYLCIRVRRLSNIWRGKKCEIIPFPWSVREETSNFLSPLKFPKFSICDTVLDSTARMSNFR